jgi:hypothetical protein
MSPRSRKAQGPSVLAAALLVTSAAAPAALQARPGRFEPPKPLRAYEAAAVERALEGAARRLESPECQKLLTDFTDGDGRPLTEKLATWGMSAAEYIRQLPFRDGATVPLCGKKSVRLAAVQGSLPVFVCPGGTGQLNSAFSLVQAENPSLAEAMVIHEMLHTLGLGENPPSTFEITERVRTRCR